MYRLCTIQVGIKIILALIQILVAVGSDVVVHDVFTAAQASRCIPSVHSCASNGADTYRSPSYHSSDHSWDHHVGNMSVGYQSPMEDHGLLFGPQRPRLAVRLYYVIKSQDLLLFGVAVFCTVLGIRMMVVPGRVWGRVWRAGGQISSLMFWTFVVVTAAPPVIALCFISGASFIMIGAAMLFLLWL